MPPRLCGISFSLLCWLMLVLQICLAIIHSPYWTLIVMVSLGIGTINVIRSAAWTYGKRFQIVFENSVAYPSQCVNGPSYVNERTSDEIAEPGAVPLSPTGHYSFSNSVTGSPYHSEHIAVEVSLPDLMPELVHHIHVDPVDETTQVNNNATQGQPTVPIIHDAVPADTTDQVNNSVAELPVESSYDMDFSRISNDTQDDDDDDSEASIDANARMENFESQSTAGDPENIVDSASSIVQSDQINAFTTRDLPTDSSHPETMDTPRNVNTESTIVFPVNFVNRTQAPKEEVRVDANEELTEHLI